MTQSLFRIDMVKQSRKTVKTTLNWKLNGMQYQRLDFSLRPWWRTGATELELDAVGANTGMVQGCWGREAVRGCERIYGSKDHQRGSFLQQVGSSYCMQTARAPSEVWLGFHVKNHFILESSSTLDNISNLKKFILFNLLISQLGI